MKSLSFFLFLLELSIANCDAQGKWVQKADLPVVRRGTVGFGLEGKGYIGTGTDGIGDGGIDLWEYYIEDDLWTQKANIPAEERINAIGFSLNNYGFIGTGIGNIDKLDDLWRYDPSTNTWEKKADFGGGDRAYAVGISIGDKGYIGTGSTSTNARKKDWWEYDPVNDTWTQKSDLPAPSRHLATGFAIGDKGYLCLGVVNDDPSFSNDLWEFDPATNTWIKKADFPGNIWCYAAGFSIGSKGYLGLGLDTSGFQTNEFWEYDQVTDSWSQQTGFTGPARIEAVGFAIGNNGYIGTGKDDITDSLFKDFWQFTPGCSAPASLVTTSITQSKATLQWNAADGAAGYKLRYKEKNTSTWKILSSNDGSKSISGLSAGTTYVWQVKTICSTAPIVGSEWSAKNEFTTSLRLGTFNEPPGSLSVYPNPVSAEAIIRLFIEETSGATLELFDVSGKKVQTLLATSLEAGNHEVLLRRNQLTPGIYLLSFTAGEKMEVVKILIE